jgi:YVTN family beta-propeller protein
VRRALGKDRIARRPPGYVLCVAAGELDLERFERLRQRGREQFAEHDAAAAASSFAQALALWRGAALADVLYEPFAPVEAAQLEELRLLALEDRVEAQLALGHARELVPELERMAAEHPLRERVTGQLMLALYRAGRQAEALDAYRSARRRLTTELGLEPAPALRELERAILAHDLAPEPVPAAAPSAPGARREWRRAAGATAVLVAALCVVAIGVGGHGKANDGAKTVRGDSAVALARASGRIEHVVALPGTPSAVAADGSSVWVGEPGRNDVVRIDATSGTIRDRIPLPSQPGEIAIEGGSIWVASTVGGSVARIDREAGRITQAVRLRSGSAAAMAVGAGGLWVADATHHSLVEIVPATGAVRRRISLGFTPSAVAIDGGAAWVADYDGGIVAQVDLASEQPVVTVHVGNGPAALAAGGGAVWVANSLDGTVSRLDPATGTVTATIAVGSGPAALALGGRSVWVANTYSGTVTRIDAVRRAVTRTVSVGGTRPRSPARPTPCGPAAPRWASCTAAARSGCSRQTGSPQSIPRSMRRRSRRSSRALPTTRSSRSRTPPARPVCDSCPTWPSPSPRPMTRVPRMRSASAPGSGTPTAGR